MKKKFAVVCMGLMLAGALTACGEKEDSSLADTQASESAAEEEAAQEVSGETQSIVQSVPIDEENSTVQVFDSPAEEASDMTANERAEAEGLPLSVCGEMASRPESVMVLAGMGVRTLSMSPKLITSIKELLSKISVDELKAISSKRLNSL